MTPPRPLVGRGFFYAPTPWVSLGVITTHRDRNKTTKPDGPNGYHTNQPTNRPTGLGIPNRPSRAEGKTRRAERGPNRPLWLTTRK